MNELSMMQINFNAEVANFMTSQATLNHELIKKISKLNRKLTVNRIGTIVLVASVLYFCNKVDSYRQDVNRKDMKKGE